MGRFRWVVAAAIVLLVVAVGVVLAVTLASDDGDSSDSASSAADEPPRGGPCGLLTTSEVSQVTGQVMGDAGPVPGEPDNCEWVSTESSASEDVRSPMKVTVTVGDVTAAAVETLEELDSPGEGFRVAGLGDDAVMVCGLSAEVGPGCATHGPLLVVVGDRYVTVDLSNFAWPADLTQEQVRSGLEALARLAVDRLPDS